jgi:hypothetical protein
MRKKRIAYNELIDEFGNVSAYEYSSKASFSFKKSAFDFIFVTLKFIAVAIFTILAWIFKLMGKGLKVLLEEKPHQKVKWDGIIPKK